MMSLLSGMKVIKNKKLKKQRLRKNSPPLPGIHQDIGIGACQKMIRGGGSNE